MSGQKENQTMIESFEDDSYSLWVPHGPVITNQPLISMPCSPVQACTEQPDQVQVDEEIFFTNKPVDNTVLDKENTGQTNISKNDESDNTLHYSYSLLDGHPIKAASPESDTIDSSPGDLSKSLFSETSSPVRNKAHSTIVDRFNGILYHEYHFNGQIVIVFSSDDLYNGFINAVNKELHAKKISEVRSNYTTHVRGKGCTLITDSDHCSVSASGQGSKLWREMIFTRMVLHLYKQFTKDINSKISVASSQSFNMTFTPSTCSTTNTVSSPNVTPVTVKPGIQRRIVHNKLSLSEINSHVAELTQISKSLQNQLSLVNSKIDALLERSTQCSEQLKSGNTSASTISDNSFITLSETLDNDDSKLVPGRRTYSSVVANEPNKSKSNNDKATVTQKPTDECDIINDTDKRSSQKYTPSPTCRQNNQPTGRTLLIGDSVLSGINKKGLRKGVECKSVAGAKIDTILETIEIFDISKFDNIVVYVGGNDVSGETVINHFEQQFGKLISLVKSKNSKCKVLLSNMCPRGDVDVTEINDVITDLCLIHKVTLINSNDGFYDKKKKLRSHFYKPWDSVHLSRSGTKRLLGSFEQHIAIVENFEKCVYQGRTKSDYNVRGHYYQQPNEQTEIAAERCMKCGLTNHVTLDCFHQKQVQCHKCKCYGHKDYMGLCWNI